MNDSREVIREAIHRTVCDQGASHDASLGRCSVAADAVAMSLAPRREGLDVERVHDIIEWLGTDIEAAMRGYADNAYVTWIAATVEAHMLLSGCTNHPHDVADRLVIGNENGDITPPARLSDTGEK